jgi:hypothetical protein
MPKAGEVAAELRRIADALDKEPEAEVKRPLCFFYPDSKEEFLTLARILPHPLEKLYGAADDLYAKYTLDGKSPSVWLRAEIERSKICTLISPAIPAKYECEPLLSQEEEDALAEPSSAATGNS